MANPDERLIPLEPKEKAPEKAGLAVVLDSVNIWVNKGMAWVAAGSLLLMVFVVVGNAISRVIYVPFVGAPEVVGWLAALTLAFALGFTQLQEGYVEIDSLVRFFPGWLQRFLKTIMLLISLCFFTMVAWQLYLYGLQVADNGNLSETMGLSYYPLIFLVAVGFIGLVLALVVDFLKVITGSAAE